MLSTIVVDKNLSSKNLISSYLKEMDFVGDIFYYDNFSQVDRKNIDLVIFDINAANFEFAMENVYKLKQTNQNINFIAISDEINSDFMSKIMKEDIQDFILKPVLPNILAAAIKKIEDKNKENSSCAISVFSNKGGVGKTSLAVNLAYDIQKIKNTPVCLLDLSFNFGDMPAFLNMEPKYDIISSIEKLKNSDEKTISDVAQRYKNSNLYVLSFRDNFASYIKPETVFTLINSIKNFFPYVVIDSPSKIDESALTVLDNSSLVLLLGMLNMSSVRNLQKCYELFENLEINQEKLKLIINRYIETSEISQDDIKATTGHDVFYRIPNNYLTLIDAINIGSTLDEVNPNSNIAKAYMALCDSILNLDNLQELKLQKTFKNGVHKLMREMGE